VLIPALGSTLLSVIPCVTLTPPRGSCQHSDLAVIARPVRRATHGAGLPNATRNARAINLSGPPMTPILPARARVPDRAVESRRQRVARMAESPWNTDAVGRITASPQLLTTPASALDDSFRSPTGVGRAAPLATRRSRPLAIWDYRFATFPCRRSRRYDPVRVPRRRRASRRPHGIGRAPAGIAPPRMQDTQAMSVSGGRRRSA
jgi:hypothetical protein